MRCILATAILLLSFLQSQAQLVTAKLFGDHMVLQRNQDLPVWGWGAKNAKVTVTINGQTASTKGDAQGYWKAVLKPMQAGGPYIMNVSSGNEKLIYNDVMLGEVWLCSGQSNMEFVLKNAYGYRYEQSHAAQMQVRQFHVTDKMSLTPEKEVAGGAWVKADTNTVGDFTAVGYYFAKKISEQLHVTVGLIHSSWGGTEVEDWISREAMIAVPELKDAAKNLPDTWDGVKERVDKQMRAYAYNKQPVTYFTGDQLAREPAKFFDTWQKGNAPGALQWMGKLYSYRGEGFLQRTLKLDSSKVNQSSVLKLGLTDADLTIYINGKTVQKGVLPNTYLVNLPAGTWKGGDNSLLIELQSAQKNPSWFGYGLYGVGNDLYVNFPDTTVNMADGNWRVMPDLGKPYHFDFGPNNTAFDLYNAMINPLIPYAIAGVLWYQGESNADRAYQYRTAFPLMINDWRKRWGRDMPFYFVQLSSFGGFQSSNVGSKWAELREAQNATLKLPNTGMAVTIDIGDPYNIHPKDKADVGYRLASKALVSTYHMAGFAESPLYSKAEFGQGNAIVTFIHADNGLTVKDKYGYLKGFEIAGVDHKFYYAQAVITANNQVKVWCPQVPQPAAVRYGWTDAPIEANLYNKEGFPASPFRSDDWKGLTEQNKFE